MKLNLGCGRNQIPGYINVDSAPACQPDAVVDLEQLPWPWASNSAEEIRFIHSLEHLGQDPKVFVGIIQEVYRVAAPGCRVVIHVPHPRHDDFLNDPTHVRPVTPEMMCIFNRQMNDDWVAAGASNTPMAHYTGVDLRVIDVENALDPAYSARIGELDEAALRTLMRERNNVVQEIRMVLQVVK